MDNIIDNLSNDNRLLFDLFFDRLNNRLFCFTENRRYNGDVYQFVNEYQDSIMHLIIECSDNVSEFNNLIDLFCIEFKFDINCKKDRKILRLDITYGHGSTPLSGVLTYIIHCYYNKLAKPWAYSFCTKYDEILEIMLDKGASINDNLLAYAKDVDHGYGINLYGTLKNYYKLDIKEPE